MVLKSIGVFSLAKMMAALYGVGGFIGGAIIALFSMLGAGFAASQSEGGAFWGMLLGGGAIVILPIMYGIMGFIGGAIMAFIYNLVAGLAGGVELELE